MSDSIINNSNDNINEEISQREASHSICPLCCILMQEIRACNQQTMKSLPMDYTNQCQFILHNNIQNNHKTISNPTCSTKHVNQHSSLSTSSLKHDHISVIILDELKRFCENTTIRGLPRIVRAHNRYLRSLWSILVCILIFGCFVCMFFLARQYLEYNVIHPPRVLRHTSSPFPSVTVCNFRPISPDGLKYLQMKGWKTPRHFVLDIATYAQYIFYNRQKIEEYNAASAAFSLAGFLESLPNNEERRKLGYQHNKLIIKCQITYLNGSKPVAAPCERKGIWRKFIHAQYLNCATFEPFSELRSDTTNIEMYIYLDEMLKRAECVDCFHGEVKSQLSGALISIHGADTLPNINDKSINLKPGTLTELRLSIVENIQQMPPYGRCSKNHPINLNLHDMIYNYSEYACREATIQNDINQRCGCYSMEYPYNEYTGYEPCTGLSQFINITSCNRNELLLYQQNNTVTSINSCINEFKKFVDRMMCKRSVIENYVHGALRNCTMPCSFYSYESEQSTSTWPTKSWQLTWLNSSYNKKLGVFNSTEFKPYHEAQRLLELGNESEAANILDNIDVLERKLLAVLINRPNFDVRKVEEKEVLSLTSLLSQTGGLFSIWIGLSMISLGEVVEMCIRCYLRVKHSRNTSIYQDDSCHTESVSCKCIKCIENNRIFQCSNYHLILNALVNHLQYYCNTNETPDKTNRIIITEENNLHNLLLNKIKTNGTDQQHEL
ncbi:FMRFamide-activated amiloride-sensitive sodium channel [Schistosoma japonicum]|uniref:FMRFamide-activated amiloride-sensitive sodium channel n=1 Tax=Schistosoma japonicum TaxID=6182 RepID=A0A4Z2CZ76_SCHJA|nr:FMRFamide-activated amiloride-sensitive sodium channel [Schistosoma japonicum]